MTQNSSSIIISRKGQNHSGSETSESDLGGSRCSVSVVLGIWQVGIGHLGLDNLLHCVALHVVHGQVCGGHAEAHGVGDLVDRLDDAVCIGGAVAAPCHTVGCLYLLLDRVGVTVAVVVLAEVVLSVVLGVGRINWGWSSNHRGRSNYGSRSSSWDGVAVVGGIGQVGVADFWGNDWSSSSVGLLLHNWRWCSYRSLSNSNWGSSNWGSSCDSLNRS